MNTTAPPPLLTPEDLLRMPDGDRYELIDGRLKERSEMGAIACFSEAVLLRLLGNVVIEHRLGWVFGSDMGFKGFPCRPKTLRKPDVSFVRFGRIPDERLPKGWLDLAPDLAVEVVSPNDLYYEVDEKVSDYLDAGVRLVWLVNPDAGTAHAYAAHGTVSRLRADDVLDGRDVVPGFSCKPRDLFPPEPPTPA